MTIKYNQLTPITAYIEETRKNLEKSINTFLAAELTEEGIADALLKDFYIEPLKLLNATPVEHMDASQKRSNGYGDTYAHKGTEIRIRLRFEGNPKLFSCRASPHYMIDLEIDSMDEYRKHIYFTIFIDTLDEHVFRQKVNAMVILSE